MAINNVTAATADSPSTFASPVINQLAALLANANHDDRTDGDNILEGALFCIGGAMYLADADTAISGTQYDTDTLLAFTVSGTTATVAYTTTTTDDLTWSGAYQGWYDDDGNYYLEYGTTYYGSETIATESSWTIPVGEYMITGTSGNVYLQIQDESSTWHGTQSAYGYIKSDGENYRLYNTNDLNPYTVYYRKLA